MGWGWSLFTEHVFFKYFCLTASWLPSSPPNRVFTSSQQVVPYTPSFWDLWTSSCHRGSRQARNWMSWWWRGVGRLMFRYIQKMISKAVGMSKACRTMGFSAPPYALPCQCLGREGHLQRLRDESPKESSTGLVNAWNKATYKLFPTSKFDKHAYIILYYARDNWI